MLFGNLIKGGDIIDSQHTNAANDCECRISNGYLKTFSLETQDQNAKQMFKTLSEQQQTIVESLHSRLHFIESQEPQYKS